MPLRVDRCQPRQGARLPYSANPIPLAARRDSPGIGYNKTVDRLSQPRVPSFGRITNVSSDWRSRCSAGSPTPVTAFNEAQLDTVQLYGPPLAPLIGYRERALEGTPERQRRPGALRLLAALGSERDTRTPARTA